MAGISASMLKVDGELGEGHLRCAKRSSAALKAALQLEKNSRCVLCSAENNKDTNIVSLESESAISRLRRDVKSVYDQVGAAVSCGGQPLVSVSLVGRVVCVFGQFYSICCYCGCVCTVEQNNRYGSEICCMRCDFKMLYPCETQSFDSDRKASVPNIKCRYCGRVEPKTSYSCRFKIVSSPHDKIGHNESLPRPLRWVAFCTAHWKPWLQTALNVMEMRDVFSHISSRCRPIFSAAASAGARRSIDCTGGGDDNNNIKNRSSDNNKKDTRTRTGARTTKRTTRTTTAASSSSDPETRRRKSKTVSSVLVKKKMSFGSCIRKRANKNS